MRGRTVVMGTLPLLLGLSVLTGGGTPARASAGTGDTIVNPGSPSTHFPRNKQNEPAVSVAIDAAHPNVVVSGSNDEIDNAPCAANNCGFTPGVTDNGVYFSFNGGRSYTQPTYTGWTARNGIPHVGPVGTVPGYYQEGLVGDGDPALAFGPTPGPRGFSWSNGSRLYYASLTSNFPGRSTINGIEGIAVARTDHVAAAAHNDQSAWMRPVIASKDLTPNTFSDKEAIWADNAASSPNFGNAYVCWTSFGNTHSPIVVARSTDGGANWSDPVKITSGTPTAFTGPSGCTLRTDSQGIVYVLWFEDNYPQTSHQMIARSLDGGLTFSHGRRVADVTDVGRLDPVHVANGDPRFTFDGIAGARTWSVLSLDVANGAPSGTDASNELVMTWSDARRGLNHEEALVQTSQDRGRDWSAPVAVQQAGDRPDFPAVAISPNGTDLYLTYDAFLAPWRFTTNTQRPMLGVVRHAAVHGDGSLGAFQTLHRGAVGDARGSSENNLCCEFLGDYNYVSATRTYAAANWNDVRDAAVCPAMNAYRESFLDPSRLPKPSPFHDCPPTFGNSDIFGGSYTP